MTMNVTRRTALKSLAALAMAPTITLRQEIDHERLLRAFCDDDDYRYDLSQPWGIGSLTYASDAKHICRAEIANRVENGERRLPSNVLDLWKWYWNADGFRPFELPRPDQLTIVSTWGHSTCPYCDDRRVSYGPNYPTFEELPAPDYDVDTNTIRDVSCPACHGRSFEGPSLIEVCGVLMEYSRLKPIAALPNVRVAATKSKPHFNTISHVCDKFGGRPPEPNLILFAADGFEGMAMGMYR